MEEIIFKLLAPVKYEHWTEVAYGTQGKSVVVSGGVLAEAASALKAADAEIRAHREVISLLTSEKKEMCRMISRYKEVVERTNAALHLARFQIGQEI